VDRCSSARPRADAAAPIWRPDRGATTESIVPVTVGVDLALSRHRRGRLVRSASCRIGIRDQRRWRRLIDPDQLARHAAMHDGTAPTTAQRLREADQATPAVRQATAGSSDAAAVVAIPRASLGPGSPPTTHRCTPTGAPAAAGAWPRPRSPLASRRPWTVAHRRAARRARSRVRSAAGRPRRRSRHVATCWRSGWRPDPPSCSPNTSASRNCSPNGPTSTSRNCSARSGRLLPQLVGDLPPDDDDLPPF
jgi:hypothetical protein